jgi:hypothetical protein
MSISTEPVEFRPSFEAYFAELDVRVASGDELETGAAESCDDVLPNADTF